MASCASRFRCPADFVTRRCDPSAALLPGARREERHGVARALFDTRRAPRAGAGGAWDPPSEAAVRDSREIGAFEFPQRRQVVEVLRAGSNLEADPSRFVSRVDDPALLDDVPSQL